MNSKYLICALSAVIVAGCQAPQSKSEAPSAVSETNPSTVVSKDSSSPTANTRVPPGTQSSKEVAVKGKDQAVPDVGEKPKPVATNDAISVSDGVAAGAEPTAGALRDGPKVPASSPNVVVQQKPAARPKPVARAEVPKPQAVTDPSVIGLAPYPGSTTPSKNGVAQKTTIGKDTFYTFGRNSKDDAAKILAYYQTKLKPGSKMDAPVKSKDTVTTMLTGQTQDGAKAMVAVTRRKDTSFIFVSVQRNK